ncbi:hypothetical protein KNP414_03844 [Paenibacillus mucilaginosus KNP414]|uniref:Uncharacterized protein n=1 Tax=Paenibacillus mucilaginosus (strain KNP414) TaxID=1036673 RepID=F8F6A9_PAEMK|nr:hypothetical protein KNP414_03844 [Paenibacillus mucilaginosus KNP414]
MYKSKGIPDGIPKTPPYIYLKQENEVYEYTYPKPFFTVG